MNSSQVEALLRALNELEFGGAGGCVIYNSRFRHGDVVKVIGYNSFPELVGRECVVLVINYDSESSEARGYELILTDIPHPSKAGWLVSFNQAHLEPVIENSVRKRIPEYDAPCGDSAYEGSGRWMGDAYSFDMLDEYQI